MWLWELEGWPNFKFDHKKNTALEESLLFSSGLLVGLIKHMSQEDRNSLIIETLSNEAYKTSQIEGELLDRESIQSSIKHFFGIKTTINNNRLSESGIAEMLIDLFSNYSEKLSHDILFKWHKMIMKGSKDIEAIGEYRSTKDPMQIISNKMGDLNIHYEAPPSDKITQEMNLFIHWYNNSAKNGPSPLETLTRAAICHLYFEAIHPFEDGNGRIGRALVQKIIAEHFEKPIFINLSEVIERGRKKYYRALELQNKTLNIDQWIGYFSHTILDAFNLTSSQVQFVIDKAKFLKRYEPLMNERQKKVITRMLNAEISRVKEGFKGGFEGGLSAKNYVSISRSSSSTATRDLSELLHLGVVKKTGVLKGARYWLNMESTL